MKKLLTVLALGTAMSFGAVAGAKEKADKPLKGKISSIAPDTDDKSLTDIVITKGKNKEEVTVKADSTATVTVDGDTKTLKDLEVGEVVTITPSTGKPTSITAVTKANKKKAAAAAPTPAPDAPAAK